MNRFRESLVVGALIAVLSLASYAGSVHNAFVWDDNFQIAHNLYLHADQPWQKLFTSDVWGYAHPGQAGSNYYRPLQMLTYRLLEGPKLQPEAYHWASILTDIVACWAAWAVMYLLCKRREVALGAALLFAIHPIHSEAVLWISSLSELGCALFYFLAFGLYLEAWRAPEIVALPSPRPVGPRKKSARGPVPQSQPLAVSTPPSRGRRTGIFLGCSMAAFFVSLLWKEMALSLPLLIFVYAMAMATGASWRGRLQEALIRSSPFWIVTAGYALIRISILGYFARVQQAWALTPTQYVLSVTEFVAKYWVKLVWPAPLNSYYVFDPGRTLFDLRAMASILFVVIALSLIVGGMRRWPVPSFAAAWVFLTLAPALDLSGVGENAFTERYLYIPSLGFCLLVAWLFAEGLRLLPKRAGRPVAIAAVVLVMLASVMEVRARVPDWESDYNLLSATLKVSPNSAVTHNGLGEILRDQKGDLTGAEREFHAGYDAAAASTPQNTQQMAHGLVGLAGVAYQRGQVPQSLDYVNRALDVDSSFAGAHVSKGVILLTLGRLDEAEQTFQQIYQYDPNDVVVVNCLGLIALARQQTNQAMEYFSHATNIDPDYPDGYENMGRALAAQGKYSEAAPFFRRALDLAPANALFHVFYGQALGNAGELQEARREFERALTIDPSQEGAKQSLKVLDQTEAQRSAAGHP